MRVVSWERQRKHISDESRNDFYEKPLLDPVMFRFKTQSLDVPEHGGALSLKLVLSGCEHYQVEGYRRSVKPGQFLFINAGQRYASHIDEPTESVSVFVPDADARALWSDAHIDVETQLDDPTYLPAPDAMAQLVRPATPATCMAVKQMLALTDRSDPHGMVNSLQHLLKTSFRDAIDVAPPRSLSAIRKRATRDELLARLWRARDYIEDMQGQVGCLDDLAAVACLSKYYFLRLFKEVFHQSPLAFARLKRLEAAQRALASGCSMAHAAYLAGFVDQRAFARAYKQTYGEKPVGS